MGSPGIRRPGYDDTGDFGPGTAGIATAGWQEALDYCAGNAVDLCVEGGYGGMRATNHVQETISFPPARDSRVGGGVYVVNWTGPRDRDLMVIDSRIDCEPNLGILVYGGAARARAFGRLIRCPSVVSPS